MGSLTPLLRIFRTEENIYAYSGHTNLIMRISEAIADILEYYGTCSEEEIILKLRKKHRVSDLKVSYGHIQKAQRDFGYFSPGILESRFCTSNSDVSVRLVSVDPCGGAQRKPDCNSHEVHV